MVPRPNMDPQFALLSQIPQIVPFASIVAASSCESMGMVPAALQVAPPLVVVSALRFWHRMALQEELKSAPRLIRVPSKPLVKWMAAAGGTGLGGSEQVPSETQDWSETVTRGSHELPPSLVPQRTPDPEPSCHAGTLPATHPSAEPWNVMSERVASGTEATTNQMCPPSVVFRIAPGSDTMPIPQPRVGDTRSMPAVGTGAGST